MVKNIINLERELLALFYGDEDGWDDEAEGAPALTADGASNGDFDSSPFLRELARMLESTRRLVAAGCSAWSQCAAVPALPGGGWLGTTQSPAKTDKFFELPKELHEDFEMHKVVLRLKPLPSGRYSVSARLPASKDGRQRPYLIGVRAIADEESQSLDEVTAELLSGDGMKRVGELSMPLGATIDLRVLPDHMGGSDVERWNAS